MGASQGKIYEFALQESVACEVTAIEGQNVLTCLLPNLVKCSWFQFRYKLLTSETSGFSDVYLLVWGFGTSSYFAIKLWSCHHDGIWYFLKMYFKQSCMSKPSFLF